jgi:hypothetical protein
VVAVAVGEKFIARITVVTAEKVTGGQDVTSELNVESSSVPVTNPFVDKMG